MNDPRQPTSSGAPGAPRPAGIPLQNPQPHPTNHPQAQPHAPQHAHPHPPQHGSPSGGIAPAAAPRPALRPTGAPVQSQQSHPQHAQHPQQPAPAGPARIAPMPTMAVHARDEDAIALIDDGDDDATLHRKIKAFGNEGPKAATKWKRAPTAAGTGPVRVRTFHAKLSDQGLEYLDDAVNHFIDEHPEVDIKFVTTNVGMFDGKFKDLALIVNLWY